MMYTDELIREEREESLRKGREEGRQEGQVAMIEGFLWAGTDWSTIKRATGIDRMAFDVLRGQVRWRKMEPLEGLKEIRSMLAERVEEWTAGWVAEGRAPGLEEGRAQGIEQERRLLCRQAARKFGAETAPRLSDLLDRVADPERLAQVGEWVIECATEEELLARVQDATS